MPTISAMKPRNPTRRPTAKDENAPGALSSISSRFAAGITMSVSPPESQVMEYGPACVEVKVMTPSRLRVSTISPFVPVTSHE